MRKAKIIGVVIIFAMAISFLIISAIKKSKSQERDITRLLNFYYTYKQTDTIKAKEALDLIMKQDPTNVTAMQAKYYWYINRGDTNSALIFLKDILKLHPHNIHAKLLLANLYILLNQKAQAKPLLLELTNSKNHEIQRDAEVLFQASFPHDLMQKNKLVNVSLIEPIHFKNKQEFLPLYEKIQNIIQFQPNSARYYLHLILFKDPNEYKAYIQLGYLELQQKNPSLALYNFLKAFSIENNPRISLQIAYIYAQKKDKEKARYYFNFAKNQGDEVIKQISSEALTQLDDSSDYSIASTALPVGNQENANLWTIFYGKKEQDPSMAQKAIETLLKKYPDDMSILKEAAYFATSMKNYGHAITLWMQAYSLDPNPLYALNLGYLYDAKHNKTEAVMYFKLALISTNKQIRMKATQALENLNPAQSEPISSTPDDIEENLLWTRFYDTKVKNPEIAQKTIDALLQLHPQDIRTLKEAAYFATSQKHNQQAIEFWKKLYQLEPNPLYALSLGYLYDGVNNKHKAIEFFKLANQTSDVELKHKIEVALKNLEQNQFVKSRIQDSTENLLWRFFYDNKTKNTQIAQKIINILLKLHPLDLRVLKEAAYFATAQKKHERAIKLWLQAYKVQPDANFALSLGYLYDLQHDKMKSLHYFKLALKTKDASTQKKAKRAIANLEKASKPQTLKDKLWTQFHKNKTTNPQIALDILHRLLMMNLKDMTTLKEAAYFGTKQKLYDLAIDSWCRAYAIESNPIYALSLAYLFDQIDKKPIAYHFFRLAAKTKEMKTKLKAEKAMTNLGGAQFKILPSPFFSEFYSFPFYFSRFDLGVLPIISRTGITLNKKHQVEPYLSIRRTKDDRSGDIQGFLIQNSISQIFEDNVAIFAGGFRFKPISKIPLLAFIEIGKAEDLVNRDRPKWRNDVRGGLAYYNTWGVKPTWTPTLEFPWKWRTTLYADAIYYSRYNNNIIGTAWFRPGFRAIRYKSAAFDLYLANYLILDKNHDFFNNIYSIGPGIAFQPTNRVNVVFRFEALQNYYLPVKSSTPNPYGHKYWNNFAMMEIFFQF